MALDAGTVNIKINAQTGDTKQRIDEVKNSLDNLGDSGKLVSAAMSLAVAGVASKALDLGGNLYSSLVVPMQRASRDINSTGQAAQEQLTAMGLAAAGVADNIPLVGGLISGIISGQTQLAAEEMNILNGYKDDLKGYIDEVAGYADDILTKSSTSGLSTETVQLFDKLSGITDVDFASLETGMRTFKTAIVGAGEGDEGVLGALSKLGVSLNNPDGSAKSMDTMLWDVIGAFQSMSSELDESEQWAVATELFGPRAAAALMPLLTNSELNVDSLHNLAEEVGVLSNTELNLAGQMQDLKDLAATAKETTNQIMGLRLADATNATSQAELDYEITKRGYLRGDINPDTGELYTYDDVVDALVYVKYLEQQLDILETRIAQDEKEITDIATESVKTSGSVEEAQVKAKNKISKHGPLMLYLNETDLRDSEGVLDYADKNTQLFDEEYIREVVQRGLSVVEWDNFDKYWKGTPAELTDYRNFLWDVLEGSVLPSPEFIEELNKMTTQEYVNAITTFGEEETTKKGWGSYRDVWKEKGILDAEDLMYEYARNVSGLMSSTIAPLLYGGSYDELYAAAQPQTPPDGITGPAATKPSTEIGTMIEFSDGARQDSHDNIEYHYYGVDISTGDMN